MASLLLEQERYEEASRELRLILDAPVVPLSKMKAKASSMLFRTNAASCRWETVAEDSQSLVDSLQLDEQDDNVPVVHPFEALKWPCFSLEQATKIAGLYARRAVLNEGHEWIQPLSYPGSPRRVIQVRRETSLFPRDKPLKIGYLSPDFTSTHPLAFLMQNVFQYHNRKHFQIQLYALSRLEDCPEVNAIRDGSDTFTILPRSHSARELAEMIRNDHLDILIDLCGHTGTTLVAEILTHRPCPLQISYMGFPGSTGASYHDYMVCDPIVVPPELRHHYTEKMIWMPHCYFVNSHRECCRDVATSTKERNVARQRYGLPHDAFVFCCHSRPDKIDPTVFETWMKALVTLKDEIVVLWLLQSGPEMETNLRTMAEHQFGLAPDRLVFCNIAPRTEHLHRLGCSNVFLDTPAYNAHTLGCDALWAGVPMISLLRTSDEGSQVATENLVATEKLASRVGASLLTAAGLEECLVRDLGEYQELMVKAATNQTWFGNIRYKLVETRSTCTLFDTKRWVENLELGLLEIGLNKESRTAHIQIIDSL